MVVISGFVRFLVLFTVAVSSAATANTVASVVFSKSVDYFLGGKIVPVDVGLQFDCAGRIYATVQLQGAEPGVHQLEMEWYRPDGQLEKRFQQTLHVNAEGQMAVSNWLRLPKAGLMASFLSPSSELAAALGRWRVESRFNHALLDQSEFEVLC